MDRGRVNTRNMGKNNVDWHPFRTILSLVGQPGTSQMVTLTIESAVNPNHVQLSTVTSNRTLSRSFCQSPFHSTLCYVYVSIHLYHRETPIYKDFQKNFVNVISTIITQELDNRLFDKTKINNVEVTTLLDTGASVSYCGAGAEEFLKHRTYKIVKLQSQHILRSLGEWVIMRLLGVACSRKGFGAAGAPQPPRVRRGLDRSAAHSTRWLRCKGDYVQFYCRWRFGFRAPIAPGRPWGKVADSVVSWSDRLPRRPAPIGKAGMKPRWLAWRREARAAVRRSIVGDGRHFTCICAFNGAVARCTACGEELNG
uniref:Uncharacterized protein n=1 Tax=Glossina pallidipes TaxID=7398 RepID=A0A1A9ZC59_GLOPL